uniref:Protein kinase domain-containing protein n=1 Tax=Parascaris univalens TaxID=6257 RepID=A0A915CJ49_PARUN
MAKNDVNVADKDRSESMAIENVMQKTNAEGSANGAEGSANGAEGSANGAEGSANDATMNRTSTDDTPLKILNGLPMMETDEIFDHRFRIYGRIGWDDRVGATYFALDEKENKQVILRIDRNDNALSIVKMEAVFLREAEKHHRWIFFEQIHRQAIYRQFFYLTIYHRYGPSLIDSINYMKDHRFSHGTAARLAFDILNILEAIHKLGYLLRSMHPSMFYFDVNNRHLFLFDRTTIQIDADQLQIPAANRWVGGPQYAPIAYHRGESIKRHDEIESLFYLLIEMLTGSLPWDSARADQIEDIKEKSIQQRVLLVGLPHEYAHLQDYIMKIDGEIDYQYIGNLLKKIYQEIGEIHDLDENFDFERDPTKDELPKFILEKDMNTKDLEGKNGANAIALTDRTADTDNIGINKNQAENLTLEDENIAIGDERMIPNRSQDHHHMLIDELSAQLSNIHLQTNDGQFDAEKDNQPMEAEFPQTLNVPSNKI